MKTFRASQFRHCNVLPAALIDAVAWLDVAAIRLGKIAEGSKWWEYENQVEIDFAERFDAPPIKGDDRALVASKCSACGQCCKDIPSHQIGIYMSTAELSRANSNGLTVLTQGDVVVDGVRFAVLDIKPNGDCAMLGEHGCTLGDRKPLWCKVYHCERFANSAPPWMKEEPSA